MVSQEKQFLKLNRLGSTKKDKSEIPIMEFFALVNLTNKPLLLIYIFFK